MNERIRWKEISWIAQNAMNSLDPVHKVGSTFREVIQTHTNLSKKQARERTAELLSDVNLDPARRRDYPHELSGGQRQRVVIALALALDPTLIIADEPTTGLDVIVQDDILELIKDEQKERGNSMIFISHDVSAVAEIADKSTVMYAGNIVEKGRSVDVFKNSTHPYTVGLLNAFPEVGASNKELISIPGGPPGLLNPPTGCRFAERCPFVTDECDFEPPMVDVSGGHKAKCHYTDKAEQFREDGAKTSTWNAEQRVGSR
jgi:oligopeptide/dipeptide ABC transporter ATP-binding protein